MENYGYYPNYGYNQQQNQGVQQSSNVMAATNCDFINVNGPEQIREYVVRPGQTVYFLDNNQPIMYNKSADSFGITTTKAYRMDEISFESLIRPTAVEPASDLVSRDEFNGLATDIRSLLDKINKQDEALKSLEEKFSANDDNHDKSQKRNNDRRNNR